MKKNPNGLENCLLLQLYTVFVNKETQLLIIIFVWVFSNTVLSLTIQYVYIYIYTTQYTFNVDIYVEI